MGHDTVHSWQRLRTGGVDGANARVRTRAKEHLCVQHMRQLHVRRIHHLPRRLQRSLCNRCLNPDIGVFLLLVIRHASPPALS
ncbi:hypothetical protein SDC9_161065 [bioreactor metagenome]|uniref:Uncharacterized protein n=1 Tax=bioreactor metagenome TaxID=1076179 RepID=A0A645FH99_9ZZZZ